MSDADHVLPFQLDALGVRGRLVRLGPALDAIIERHGYPLAVARPLAEAMVLCATLAASLKYDGIFTLQISGDGPIRLLVTDLTTDGAIRGYAQFDSWKLAVALGAGNTDVPDGYVPKLFGQGRLAFTVDQGQFTERYQGVVPLEDPTLADCARTCLSASRAASDRHQDHGQAFHRERRRALARSRADGPADARVRRRPDRRRHASSARTTGARRSFSWPRRPRPRSSTRALPDTTLLLSPVPRGQAAPIRAPPVRRCAAAAAASASTACCARSSARELDDLRDKAGRVAVKCEFCSTEYSYDDSDLDRIYAFSDLSLARRTL